MIYLADLNAVTKLIDPVTTPDYVVGKGLNFHPEGLFSERIFGSQDSPERRKTFSYVDLHCKIIHPALIKPLHRLNRKVILAASRENSFKFNDQGDLVADKEGDINGISSVIKNFEKMIGREETTKVRSDMKNMIMTYWKNNMLFIDKCLIIPAFYRDAEIDEVRGGLRTKPINDYYVNIIKQSIQIESISLTEGPMYDILAAKTQQLVNDLYDYIIKKISKKEGMIRQNILGKRLDYTGGAVITGASSEVKVDEAGIPFLMLVKLFEPFIIHDIHKSGNVDQKRFAELLKDYNGDTFSIPSTRRLLTSASRIFEVNKELKEIVKASINRVISDKVVVLKRDPALHAESVQAFKPVMVEGNTIKLNILKCGAFNADFDGDRMAVYVPITKEAIAEAREKMISSKSKDSIDGISDEFSKDMVIGLYALTQDIQDKKSPITIRDDKELESLNPTTKIKYDGEVTTVGKILFNKIVPAKKYRVTSPVDKKVINSLANQIHNDYLNRDKSVYVEFCHKAVELGMKYYTIMAPSFSMSDIVDIPPSILKYKDELAKAKTPAEANDITNKMTKELQAYTEKKATNIGIIGKAGGLKNGYSQARQILISKGLITDPSGEIRVIQNSYGDGLNSDEFFESGFGSRKGIIDRVINTSETGYLSRQLVYALQRVVGDPRVKDCRTKRFMTIKPTKDISRRLKGRYIVDEDRVIVPYDEKKHLGKVIHLRSPLYCTSTGICRTCYGDMLMRNKTPYVGVLAAEVCGERLTQTIMQTFHVGGSVSIKTIDIVTEISRILDDSQQRIFNQNFVQEKSYLKSLSDGKIVVSLKDYLDPKKDITITSSKILMNYAYFKLIYGDVFNDITIDNKIEIDLKDKTLKQDELNITIEFKKDSIVFDCIPTSEAFSEQVKIIESLFAGKTPYKDSDHFLMKVYDQYSTLNTNADMIHLEILASNLLRDKGNPSFPARLNPNYNAVVKPLKAIPMLESWLQSFAFENPKASITNGLMYDRPTDETILEKLISGQF